MKPTDHPRCPRPDYPRIALISDNKKSEIVFLSLAHHFACKITSEQNNTQCCKITRKFSGGSWHSLHSCRMIKPAERNVTKHFSWKCVFSETTTQILKFAQWIVRACNCPHFLCFQLSSFILAKKGREQGRKQNVLVANFRFVRAFWIPKNTKHSFTTNFTTWNQTVIQNQHTVRQYGCVLFCWLGFWVIRKLHTFCRKEQQTVAVWVWQQPIWHNCGPIKQQMGRQIRISRANIDNWRRRRDWFSSNNKHKTRNWPSLFFKTFWKERDVHQTWDSKWRPTSKKLTKTTVCRIVHAETRKSMTYRWNSSKGESSVQPAKGAKNECIHRSALRVHGKTISAVSSSSSVFSLQVLWLTAETWQQHNTNTAGWIVFHAVALVIAALNFLGCCCSSQACSPFV